MADQRQCDNPTPHKFHGWDEPKPGAGTPYVRAYHVCLGVIAPHAFAWNGRAEKDMPAFCAICDKPEPGHERESSQP